MQLLNDPVVELARLQEFLGDQEAQLVLAAPVNGRRCIILFQVDYIVAKFMGNGALLDIEDTRSRFSGFVLTGNEQPSNFYTPLDVTNLLTTLRSLTNITVHHT